MLSSRPPPTRTFHYFATWMLFPQTLTKKEAIEDLGSKYTFRFIGDSTTRRLAESFMSIVTGEGSAHPKAQTRIDFSTGNLKVGVGGRRAANDTLMMPVDHADSWTGRARPFRTGAYYWAALLFFGMNYNPLNFEGGGRTLLEFSIFGVGKILGKCIEAHPHHARSIICVSNFLHRHLRGVLVHRAFLGHCSTAGARSDNRCTAPRVSRIIGI